jgi:hypothetical protein
VQRRIGDSQHLPELRQRGLLVGEEGVPVVRLEAGELVHTQPPVGREVRDDAIGTAGDRARRGREHAGLAEEGNEACAPVHGLGIHARGVDRAAVAWCRALGELVALRCEVATPAGGEQHRPEERQSSVLVGSHGMAYESAVPAPFLRGAATCRLPRTRRSASSARQRRLPAPAEVPSAASCFPGPSTARNFVALVAMEDA